VVVKWFISLRTISLQKANVGPETGDISACCVTQQNGRECRLRSDAPRRKIEQVDFCEQNVKFELGESGVPWKL